MSRLRSARGLLPVMVLLPVTVLLAGGCVESAGGRQEITGTVTLNGQPLDEGVIEFHPLENSSTEQLVTRSGAMITDGKYLIAEEQGLVPGKYRVVISSGDKRAPQDDGGPGPKN